MPCAACEIRPVFPKHLLDAQAYCPAADFMEFSTLLAVPDFHGASHILPGSLDTGLSRHATLVPLAINNIITRPWGHRRCRGNRQ